jgi:hypothetical protein
LTAAFLVYATLSISLYWNYPSFRTFLDGFEWISASFERFLPVLKNYQLSLPEEGKAEWVLITRHLCVMSAALIFLGTVVNLAHFIANRRHLQTEVLNQSATGSYADYAKSVFSGLAVVLVAIYVGYVGGGTLDTRAERAVAYNDYVRLIPWLGLLVLFLSSFIPGVLAGLINLMSSRIRNGLR